MSFAGSPGALAKPFRLPSALPRELRGTAGGFLFSHPNQAGESPGDAASARAAGSAGRGLFGGALCACRGV